MSDIICITSRKLCPGDFFTRLEEIAAAHPAAVVLREKDLSPEEYRQLAGRALEICRRHNVLCILHSFPQIARELGAGALHMPLHLLEQMSAQERAAFSVLGASCHSPEDALRAEQLGCTYVTAGHVFLTDCKKGLPARGLEFLAAVCQAVCLPVYAIGGISPENIGSVRRTGAAGACVMSGLMQCSCAAAYLDEMEKGRKQQ